MILPEGDEAWRNKVEVIRFKVLVGHWDHLWQAAQDPLVHDGKFIPEEEH